MVGTTKRIIAALLWSCACDFTDGGGFPPPPVDSATGVPEPEPEPVDGLDTGDAPMPMADPVPLDDHPCEILEDLLGEAMTWDGVAWFAHPVTFDEPEWTKIRFYWTADAHWACTCSLPRKL